MTGINYEGKKRSGAGGDKVSLDVVGHINRKCLSRELLNKILIDFFAPEGDITVQFNGRSITYEGFIDENILILFFVEERYSPPHNVWVSDILKGEFEFAQLLIFNLEKEYSTIDTYKIVIDFFIFLHSFIDSDILVTSDAHNDICLLKDEDVIWAQDCVFNQ